MPDLIFIFCAASSYAMSSLNHDKNIALYVTRFANTERIKGIRDQKLTKKN